MTEPLAAGVIGVGSMGRNHARVYQELPATELVGVADADASAAAEVAADYGTESMSTEDLLDAADAVSIAVPTRFHYETARKAIERDVHVLVEKPFVEDLAHGRILIERARDRGVTLQVGHVERFNPAVRTLSEIVPNFDVMALDARRLGPPVDRDIDVNPVLDLMIHDLDVIRSLADGSVTRVDASSADGDPYVTATIEFEGGMVATLTASRVTQRKVRTLSVTAREAAVSVDYIDQSVEIHRQSLPEYVEQNGDVRYRHQNVVERPTVRNGEPLKAELDAFVESARTGEEPVVTGEDGLAAVHLANRVIEAAGLDTPERKAEVHP